MNHKKQTRGLSRPAEVILALAGMILLLPLFLAIPAVIKSTSKGTVLFRQRRVGRRGEEFILYKFRTMHENSEGIRLTSGNDERLTSVGKFLRKYKLDELPQLWNVLRGEMSFAGPRPEVSEYVDLNCPLWREILAVRPGISDPVALKLRNEEELLAAVEDKEKFYTEILQPFKLRGWAQYARHKTWKTDLSVIFKTLKVILLPRTAPPPTRDELSVAIIE